MSVENSKIAEYSERGYNVTLSSLANAFMVSVSGPETSVVNSHSDRKRAEIDYAYFKHYIQQNNI